MVTSQMGRKAYEAESGRMWRTVGECKAWNQLQVRGQKASHFVLARGLYCSCPVLMLVWAKWGPETAGRNNNMHHRIAELLFVHRVSALMQCVQIHLHSQPLLLKASGFCPWPSSTAGSPHELKQHDSNPSTNAAPLGICKMIANM